METVYDIFTIDTPDSMWINVDCMHGLNKCDYEFFVLEKVKTNLIEILIGEQEWEVGTMFSYN